MKNHSYKEGTRFQYSLYKAGKSNKMGALQINLMEPKAFKNDKDEVTEIKPGGLFLEFAPPFQDGGYDWKSKASFRLTIDEIGQVLYSLKSNTAATLFHDSTKIPGYTGEKYMKKLGISPGTNGSMFIEIAVNGQKLTSVPVSPAEIEILVALLTKAIPASIGW